MSMSPLEMSEMHRPMHECMSSFTEEKMAKAIVENSGYKMNRETTSKKEGRIFSL